MLTGLVTRYVLAKYVPAKLRSICSCGKKKQTKKTKTKHKRVLFRIAILSPR